MNTDSNLTKSQIKDWWRQKRSNYNAGLAISGILAFILYVILGVNLIMPYDNDFDITLFTIIFQAVGYLMMILIANLFYSLGSFLDIERNSGNPEKFRQNLYNLGFGSLSHCYFWLR